MHTDLRLSMRTPLSATLAVGWAVLFILLGAQPVSGGEEALADGVLRIRNGTSPAEGRTTWRLQELWRAGGDDDEILYGVISHIAADEKGNLYLLDSQLNQVHVYGPDGGFLRTLGREGDGPGEFRFASDLVLLPDGSVGVAQTMPGKIIRLDRAGDPLPSLIPGGNDPTSGGFSFLDEVLSRGDYLGIAGRELQRTAEGFNRVRYLALLDAEGREKVRLVQDSGPDPIVSRRFVERDEYFVSPGGWTLGSDGTVYTAEQRDAYRIHAYAPDGRLLRVIEREFTPRKRTADEKSRVGEGLIAVVNGERIQFDIEAEDYAQCIAAMHVADNGDLWVLSGRGSHDQPEGILQTYDVFGGDGHFKQQVAIACDGDAETDRLFLLSGQRAVLVTGFTGAARAMAGREADDEEEAAPVEIVCYAVVEA